MCTLKIIGKIKAFSITKRNVCKKCDVFAKRESSDVFRCPKCGRIPRSEVKPIWIAIVPFDIFDKDITAFLTGNAISQMLSKIGVSWRNSLDTLKNLRNEAYFENYKILIKETNEIATKRLVGKTATFYGESINDNAFYVKRVGAQSQSITQITGAKFVEGTIEELNEISRISLASYSKEIELWEGEMPVVRYKRQIDTVDIEIGLRAPLQERGKSYRIWMRVNGTHMYPAEPVKIGTKTLDWVWRVYHTKGWKDKLKEYFDYCTSREKRVVSIVKAAEQMQNYDVRNAIQELSEETQEQILNNWHGGTLWQLVHRAATFDRAAGLLILRKFNLIPDSAEESSSVG